MDKDDYFRHYWNTSEDAENSEHQNQQDEYNAIIELRKRIQDSDVRIQWHTKSMERGNRLRGYFTQFIYMDKAKLAELQLEFEQRRAAYEKKYGITLKDL